MHQQPANANVLPVVPSRRLMHQQCCRILFLIAQDDNMSSLSVFFFSSFLCRISLPLACFLVLSAELSQVRHRDNFLYAEKESLRITLQDQPLFGYSPKYVDNSSFLLTFPIAFRGNSFTTRRTVGIWYGIIRPLAHCFKSDKLNSYSQKQRGKEGSARTTLSNDN